MTGVYIFDGECESDVIYIGISELGASDTDSQSESCQLGDIPEESYIDPNECNPSPLTDNTFDQRVQESILRENLNDGRTVGEEYLTVVPF